MSPVGVGHNDQGRDGGRTGALGVLMKGFLEKEEVCTLSQEGKIRRNKNHRNSKQVHETLPDIISH